MLNPGDPAPAFDLPTDEGSNLSLADLRGKKVVLYFYPADDTPGCTRQACSLRDNIDAIEGRGAVVLGVSPDDVKSHAKFRSKFALPFRLLADTDHQLAEAYGVWKEKRKFGRTYMGVERSTFVIDEHGRIAAALPRVDPDEHVDRVLEVL